MDELLAVTGKRGAGKTYFCVNKLLEEYYDYTKASDSYRLKENYLVITNIANLQLEHIDLVSLLEKETGFLTLKYQDANFGNDEYERKLILISEAHKFIKKLSDEQINFFNESRHYGWEIVLDTQNIDMLDRRVQNLIDMEIRAIPAKYVPFPVPVFIYKKIDNREIIGYTLKRKKQVVFEKYESQKGKVIKRKKTLLSKIFPFLIILFIWFLYKAGTGEKTFGMKKRKSEDIKKTTIEQKKKQGGKSSVKVINNKVSKSKNIESKTNQLYKQRLVELSTVEWPDGRVDVVSGERGLIPIETFPGEVVKRGSRYYGLITYNLSSDYEFKPNQIEREVKADE